MAEDLRFFLRVALYAAVLTVIYWFASYNPVEGTYDWAGTVLLAASALAAAAVVAVAAAFARRALHGRPGSPPALLGRWLLFADPGGEADEQPLSAGLQPLPRASWWPLVGAVAATLVALGLIYGPWLLLPGLVLVAWVAWGWVTQLRSIR